MITVHNFPEGMVVGVGAFTDEAVIIAIAIGLQNIPEGAAVPASLIGAVCKQGIFFDVFCAVVAELVGGIIRGVLITVSKPLFPYEVAFAGGAMFMLLVMKLFQKLIVGF